MRKLLPLLLLLIATPLLAVDLCPSNPPLFSEKTPGSLISTTDWDAMVANSRFLCQTQPSFVPALAGTWKVAGDWHLQSVDTHQEFYVANDGVYLTSLDYAAGVSLDPAGGMQLWSNGSGSPQTCGSGDYSLEPHSSAGGWLVCNNGTLSAVGSALDKYHINPTASPPASPAEGDLYFDTSHALCVYISGGWTKLTGAGTCS